MDKIKVLLADDSPTMHKMIKACLNEQLYEMKVVTDGYEALTVFEGWKPDIILLDIMMPGKSGYQGLKEIREKEKAEGRKTKTAIVMVTGMSDKNDIADCAKLGIQGYLIKPFKPADIAERVESALKAVGKG